MAVSVTCTRVTHGRDEGVTRAYSLSSGPHGNPTEPDSTIERTFLGNQKESRV